MSLPSNYVPLRTIRRNEELYRLRHTSFGFERNDSQIFAYSLWQTDAAASCAYRKWTAGKYSRVEQKGLSPTENRLLTPQALFVGAAKFVRMASPAVPTSRPPCRSVIGPQSSA